MVELQPCLESLPVCHEEYLHHQQQVMLGVVLMLVVTLIALIAGKVFQEHQ